MDSPHTHWTGDDVHGKRPILTPVWIHLDTLFRRREGDSVHTVGDGLDLEGRVEGLLSGWFRSVKGDWLGIVTFSLRYADGRRNQVHVTDQLVPAHALRERGPSGDS
jgi:hypothetical protein